MTIEVISLFLTGDPGGIQTHDLQNRNLMLYSAKLQGQNSIASAKIAIIYKETIAQMTKKTNCFASFISIFKTKEISLPIMRKQKHSITTKFTTETGKT